MTRPLFNLVQPIASSSKIKLYPSISISKRYQSNIKSPQLPLPNGYTFYPNHNDTPFEEMSKSIMKSEPRPDQIYQSKIDSPHLPRMSVYHYLFPFKKYKSKHRTRFYYYKEQNLEKPTFINGLNGKFLTRKEIEEKSKSLSTGLKLKKIEKDEIGCLFGMNSLEWVISCFAIQALGGIVSPANYAYQPAELLHQLKDSTASYAFVQPSLLPVFLKALELDSEIKIPDNKIFLLCDQSEKDILKNKGGIEEEWSNRFLCLDELYEKPGTPKRFQDGMEERTAYLCYSSGTTGKGKGVETSHHNITSQVQALNCCYEPIKYNDVILAMLPFSHIYGLTVSIHQPLTVNGTVVILPRFEEIAFLEAVQRFKVTWALVVPPILIALLNSPNVEKYDISSIRGLMSGAAPLSSDLVEAFEKKFPNIKVTQGYGLTETSPVSNVMNIEESKVKGRNGKIGKILPTYQARLVDQLTGKDVEPFDRGELWLRGPSVMKGYWKNQKATSEVFAPGGWYKTGDIATIDKEGYFSIVDRVKELIKYKGFQVPPAELEALLLTHPEITDVGVIGVYSKEQATELPRAYVVPKGGISSLPTEKSKNEFSLKIQEWVASKVSNQKKLRGGVILIDIIPKSPSGKILRKDLRALSIREEEERVQKGRIAKL
ncbi:uncharacterized protein I206_104909 [Kwoniella pini CBS 10737]|uniref:AMP-binding protein n=1 Tax=Kwoniella pini CBS 10737 TaxID=1296096 RepID=A0A1B9I8B0_9TREE|nr:uncharacterized protein I206_02449 [Kwoniella pini CBS 10737]OCF51734.1 hypothetical protein I206_02449 [Kwoniella pini CBS 10737]